MHSSPLLWALAALFLVAVLGGALARPKRRGAPGLDQPWPLQPAPTLLSPAEQTLYRRLVEALPQYDVLCQVHLLQALRFERGGWSRSLANRINQLSIDFLVLKTDTSIVAAVELDDASHQREDRREADARKSHALKSAGIPLLRWQARQLPDGAAIADAFANLGADRNRTKEVPVKADNHARRSRSSSP